MRKWAMLAVAVLMVAGWFGVSRGGPAPLAKASADPLETPEALRFRSGQQALHWRSMAMVQP